MSHQCIENGFSEMMSCMVRLQGEEYGKYSLQDFRSWLVGLSQSKDVAAYEGMKNSVCWREGSTSRMCVQEAIERYIGA